MALEAHELLGDVAPLGEDRGLLCDPARVQLRRPGEANEPLLDAAAEGGEPAGEPAADRPRGLPQAGDPAEHVLAQVLALPAALGVEGAERRAEGATDRR